MALLQNENSASAIETAPLSILKKQALSKRALFTKAGLFSKGKGDQRTKMENILYFLCAVDFVFDLLFAA